MDVSANKSATLFTIAILLLSLSKAKAQRGLEVKNDTLTKTVLIHPVLEIGEVQNMNTNLTCIWATSWDEISVPEKLIRME